jgi:hypothetical protein
MTHTHNNEAPIDRAQEDRTVEFLRSRGVFRGRAMLATVDAAALPPRRNKWRVPVIAAAAAVLLAFITMLAERIARPPAGDTPPNVATPRLLIWY